MEEGKDHESCNTEENENGSSNREGLVGCDIKAPVDWFKMLSRKTHWTAVVAVVVVYGLNQGLGGALARVGTEYYMKDVQKVQPSESQAYLGITRIPWIIKPIWGLLTDVVPVFGYRRRPYFVLAGILGIISMFYLSFHEKLHIVLALLSLTIGSAGVAIADVTVDACVAQHSGIHPSLAPDMQSLCALSSSIGALIGFSLSGVFVHLIGPKGVYGLLSIPYALVLLVGLVLKEPHSPSFAYGQITEKFVDAATAMWTTLKSEDVWRPCLYMYLSFALSLDIYEGLFYWETDSKAGPSFSQGTIGFILSIGSIGSLLGAILYQYNLKDHPFRALLFWTQLIFGLSGMLDLVFILRLNLKLGIPDYFFAVIDESVFQLIGRLKWMPLLVLSSQLCPPGIEGTFFALLMSIDNFGRMSSTWLGGLLLHVLNVTRTQFDNLWLAILIRNILRITPLCFLFLVPKNGPDSLGFSRMEVLSIVEDSESSIEVSTVLENSELLKSEEVELTPLVSSVG
ncbi:Biopterin transport-related protein BT1 [Artemisia annua]|uniref:Biopterin transport-related protein BT1 n=1 Tax=Artemisia annua TaxID=35608 RepID=A0A2U1QIN5_ARTAN|nr:Biopterin transport-related protein BT1 [Artemisia annua]